MTVLTVLYVLVLIQSLAVLVFGVQCWRLAAEVRFLRDSQNASEYSQNLFARHVRHRLDALEAAGKALRQEEEAP